MIPQSNEDKDNQWQQGEASANLSDPEILKKSL